MYQSVIAYLSIAFFVIMLSAFPSVSLAAANWSEIDTLEEQGLFADIPPKLDIIIQQAKQEKADKDWRDALLLRTSLLSGEDDAKAIDYLSGEAWPQDQDSQLLLNLHLAYFTQRYIESNSWQINQRDTIDSDKPLSTGQKTLTQLQVDAHNAFSKAYRLSLTRNDPISRLNTLPTKQLKGYFTEGDYPENIRGTVRDTVTYLWIQALQNTSGWTPQQSIQSFDFPLPALLASPYAATVDPTVPGTHPLSVIAKLASDLEQFHQLNQQPEAALEAFRVKAEAVTQIRTSSDGLLQVIDALRLKIQQQQNSGTALPWVNQLRLDLADYINRTNTPTSQIERLEIIKQCLAEFPQHRLHSSCQQVADSITGPAFSLTAMESDGINKRSLALDYQNIDRIYFRAMKLSETQAIQGRDNRGDLLKTLLADPASSQYQWDVELAKTSDYRQHKHYVTPPMQQKGRWMIAASTDPSFSEKAQLVFTEMSVTHLLADVRTSDSELKVTTYQGESGHIAANIDVELWQFDYGNPRDIKRVATARSGSDGLVSLTPLVNQGSRLVLRSSDDFTLVDQLNPGYGYRTDSQQSNAALLFTDRAIYRPSQKILWKVVAYQGDSEQGRYQVLVNADGWVKLSDANGQLVKNIPVKTNDFGSASGEFTAEPGRLLGSWSIETSWGGYQRVSVEEYKRPTFEASLIKPENSLRLNHPASISGSARYYFGEAVSSGNVSWRVERQATSFGGQFIQNETIASGKTELDEKGEFVIPFTPKAPRAISERNADSPQMYSYEVSADITDSGGETRSVNRSFNVADVNVTATINSDLNYVSEGQPLAFSVSRQDMDREGRAGAAYWELYRLEQPSTAQMPADLPAESPPKEAQPYATADDQKNPRWASAPGLDELSKHWKDGAKIAQGALKHEDDGVATISLTAPAAGLYRLRYTTKDQWGQEFQTDKTVLVANPQLTPVNAPALLQVQQSSVEVGKQVTLLAGSAFPESPVLLEVFHGNKLLRRSVQRGGIKQQNFAVTQEYRGGLTFVMTMVKDYQLIRQQQFVNVPWTDRNLNVSFSTFRDKLRPGQKETWRVTVKDDKNKPMEAGAVEVLSAMYDRSLDLLQLLDIPDIANLYHVKSLYSSWQTSVGPAQSSELYSAPSIDPISPYQMLTMNLIQGNVMMAARPMMARMSARPMMAPVAMAAQDAAASTAVDVFALQSKLKAVGYYNGPEEGVVSNGTRAALKQFMENREGGAVKSDSSPSVSGLDGIVARTNFNETAFFKPHLILEKNGSVSFEFEVPESLTQWKVWVSALTKDLRGGSATAVSRTSKELMIRPYLPRFLRAGDEANIEVLINNSSEKTMTGSMQFEVIDPATENSLAENFKLNAEPRNFSVPAGQSTRQRYSLVVPGDLGMVAIRAKASGSDGTQSYGDGEQRPLPVLPSRIHLSQSRFAALQGNTQRQLRFDELAVDTDPTRINDKLVVTVDGQLFYSALKAVPYLTDYPYECTEQTMNRFLSTSIINSTFAQTPSLKAMATEFAKRKTKLENWSSIENDPNSKMLLEETPWLAQANGGGDEDTQLLKVLDPTVSAAQQQQSLQKLIKAQTNDGGFPWWEGGPASPYMTAYLLQGFARAAEFGVEVPKDTVQRAWSYLYQHYIKELKGKLDNLDNAYTLISINYTLSSFPDSTWYNDVFSQAERTQMLDISMQQWQTLPPLLKAQLALTLRRMGREQQATQVFESVMNGAKSDPDSGVYWAQQNRSWLWYNDRIDTHAFMLRAMMEINPQDARRHGLVQWLMLNKKLNHWKSTRATAESIYALVYYLKREQQLGVDERMVVSIGNLPAKEFVFNANQYSGGKQQLVIKDKDITADMANITLKNDSKPLMFASATWHFSTDIAPTSEQGDFFAVTRQFFKRIKQGTEWTLQPLAEDATLKVGDELEVQLSLSSKHNAEYVHLRAPRGAGFEPMESNSGYSWQNGVGYYQEIRDSGVNYFFDRLPTGEYAFKYRLRATTSGKFRVAPATVQSVYAPEFNAYSSGARLSIQ